VIAGQGGALPPGAISWGRGRARVRFLGSGAGRRARAV
jgi:hypothetical protein